MRLPALLALCCLSAVWAADNKPVEIVNKVEPDWGTLTSGYIVEQRDVELAVSRGEPFYISAKLSVPDQVVRALAQWRFKGGDFIAPIKIPVRIALTPEVETAQSPSWSEPPALNSAYKKAYDFDASKAAALFANLPNGEEPDNPRSVLLLFYARNGTADPETARKARRELILWLIRNYPQDAILGSPFAIVNAAGEPLADPEGSALVKQAWLDALKQYPNDNAVALGAANFLRFTDPMAALQMISNHHGLDKQGSWLGGVAAAGALGVNSVALGTGHALATSNKPSGVLRQALLQSPDLKVVLSGMATVSIMGRQLNTVHALPADYSEFCEALLKHTRDLYPQTSLTCDTTPLPAYVPGSLRIGGQVVNANLIKKVQPVYPREAKDRRIQGTVEFIATIEKTGEISNLDLVRAPLALYDTSRTAVQQWTYRPTLLEGKPVAVITDIIVNFTLSQ